ncbi:hypothetical protein GH714_031735 [Hevea brasiliensis]|uniref:Uncharacterized protein n=1 Tax=Hevea brasiliensis TaxID=3981 RepID=A0A6A6LFN1_HEVBR|nr:hypothetical protein GH714_031735 [Hevea brasiliensis]
MNYLIGAFKPACNISITFTDGKTRKQVPMKKENGQTVMVPLFQSQENIAGKISIEPLQGKRVEHNGIKVELLGQIVRELDIPGEIYERKTYPFEFSTVEMPYETYNGVNVRLSSHTLESGVWSEAIIGVRWYLSLVPSQRCDHWQDIFLLVRIKIKNMDLEIRRRESTGAGANTHVETETLAKFELMDGAPVRAKRVGTHDGTFQCDEVLACSILRLTNAFSNAQIVSTRDPQVLDSLDAVLDVGGMYDPSPHRFDHYQNGFEQVFGHGFTTKLSTAGLVYKHYGLETVAKELQLDERHPNVHRLFLAVYKNFVEAVDAIDNGISQYYSNQPPRYVNNTSLSSRVGIKSGWIDSNQSSEREDEAFEHAMELASHEFLESINFHANSWLPARPIIMECLASREDIDHSGEIMVLTRSCPWKLHIFELEEEMKIDPSIKYVIYQDDRSENWRLQAVAVSPDKFESRKPLPLAWRGLVDDELSEVTGIPGCVFVHMSGFTGGNRSYGGALAMARLL